MSKTTNNIYTNEVLNIAKLPDPDDCPYTALGDTIIIAPMEVFDYIKPHLILTPGVGATNTQQLQSRLLKGRVISVGQGVVGMETFILPERPCLGDIVYFEAHSMKLLPGNYALLRFESTLFVLDDMKPEKMQEILDNDLAHIKNNADALCIGRDVSKLGAGQKW